MATVLLPVSIELPAGSQASAALKDAVQLMAQSLLRLQHGMRHQLQEALHQQMQEALLQQEQRMLEIFHKQAQDANEKMEAALRQQEEALREAVRQQALVAAEKFLQRKETSQRGGQVLKETENRKPATVASQETPRKRKRIAVSAGEIGSGDGALELLEGRIAKLEEGVGRALENVFPRVEVLVAHLEATARPRASPSGGCSGAAARPSTPVPDWPFPSVPDSSTAGSPASVCRLSISPEPDAVSTPPPLSDPVERAALGEELLEAVAEARLRDVRRLLDAGADANYPNAAEAVTPLMMACNAGDDLTVSLLLQRGADVHLRANGGDTALHFTAREPRAGQCVALLVEAGAHVDARDSEGWTPLHLAAGYENHSVAHMLLRTGASKASRNRNGSRPSDIANSAALCQLLE